MFSQFPDETEKRVTQRESCKFCLRITGQIDNPIMCVYYNSGSKVYGSRLESDEDAMDQRTGRKGKLSA